MASVAVPTGDIAWMGLTNIRCIFIACKADISFNTLDPLLGASPIRATTASMRSQARAILPGISVASVMPCVKATTRAQDRT
jgi:hypothetical protein